MDDQGEEVLAIRELVGVGIMAIFLVGIAVWIAPIVVGTSVFYRYDVTRYPFIMAAAASLLVLCSLLGLMLATYGASLATVIGSAVLQVVLLNAATRARGQRSSADVGESLGTKQRGHY